MSRATASEGGPDDPVPATLAPPQGATSPVRHLDAPAPGTLLGAHHEQFFGCGEGRPHGLPPAVRAGEGVAITAEFTVRPAHPGAPGLAHGVARAFEVNP